MRNKLLAAGLMAVLVVAASAQQRQPEDKSKRPSPPGTAEITLKGQKITVDYSRPFLKGRTIGTDIVPYGKIWRTGANEATTLATPVDLEIAGVKLPRGQYTIWTLPSAGTWKLIINRQTGQWGTNYDEKQDFARIDMQKGEASPPVEQFTISFEPTAADAANLVLEWGTVKVWVPVKAR